MLKIKKYVTLLILSFFVYFFFNFFLELGEIFQQPLLLEGFKYFLLKRLILEVFVIFLKQIIFYCILLLYLTFDPYLTYLRTNNYKVIMQGELFQRCTHLLFCSVLSLGSNVNTRRMSQPDMGSFFNIKNQ